MTTVDPQFTYHAIAIEQQPEAPIMYVLGVAADELLEWADVPNAKSDYMAGYQRVYSPERAISITEFLRLSPKNILPGAIIVTVNADNVKIATGPEGICTVSILKNQDQEFTDSLERLHNEFYARLSESEIASIAAPEIKDAAEESDEPEEDIGIPESYIAKLTTELKQAITDFQSLPPDRQEGIKSYVESVSKPGLIIDGQHRVFGAKDVSENSVILPIVLLPGLDFAEQVFHFYILNNKAKPLTATELRRTISTSLTNQEITDLWQRFEDADVDPEATRWTFKVNTEPSSPFNNLIDFGLGGTGFLKENVVYQLITKFVNMPAKYSLLYQGISSFEKPKDDGRLAYFYAFWNAIKYRYAEVWADGVANVGKNANGGNNQLFMKASMVVLQGYLLDQLVQYTSMKQQMEGGPSPFHDLDDLDKAVRGALGFLPPEFFSEEWQVKQVDTTDGHKFLRNQMEMAIQGQGQNFRKQLLFKKTKSQQ